MEMKEEVLNWLKMELDTDEKIEKIGTSSQSILGEMIEQFKKAENIQDIKEIELALKIYDSKVNAVAMQRIIKAVEEGFSAIQSAIVNGLGEAHR